MLLSTDVKLGLLEDFYMLFFERAIRGAVNGELRHLEAKNPFLDSFDANEKTRCFFDVTSLPPCILGQCKRRCLWEITKGKQVSG